MEVKQMEDRQGVNNMNKTSAKYAIGILAAVTLVIGAMAGGLVSAEENAEVNEIAKEAITVSAGKVIERLEAKGFEVTVDGDTVTAYKEWPGKTITMTLDCPDGECTKPEPPEGKKAWGAMGKKRFHFRMHGVIDIEAIKAKMTDMGLDADTIEAKITAMGEKPMGLKEGNGFKACPFAENQE
jgi:hypothetical protein